MCEHRVDGPTKIAQLICNVIRSMYGFYFIFNKKENRKDFDVKYLDDTFFLSRSKVVQIKFEYSNRLFGWKHIKMFIERQKFFYRDFFTSSSTPEARETKRKREKL